MTQPAVRLSGVSRRFRRTQALDDLTLDIPTNAITGLLGRNGAGKTTLMSIIAGHDRQEAIRLNTYRPANATGDTADRRRLSAGKKGLADDHRFTSIEHTLIDVLIAAHSKTFKPGIYSSLSDLVHMFARIGKKDRGWCS